MKKDLCQTCDNLTQKDQVIFYNSKGWEYTPPLRVRKPFCKEYNLHIEYMDRIIEGDQICLHYIKDGIS